MRQKQLITIALIAGMIWAGISAHAVDLAAVGYDGVLIHINGATGESTVKKTGLPAAMQALAWISSDTLYAARSNLVRGDMDLFQIDPKTGLTTHVLPISTDVRGMAYSSGTLFVVGTASTTDTTPRALRSLDIQDGTFHDIGVLWGAGRGCQGLAVSPDVRLFGVSPDNFQSGTYALYTIDTDDAEMHLVGRHSNGDLNQSIAFASDGSLYAIGQRQFARIDPVNAAVIGQIHLLQGDFRGLEVIRTPPPPPEPTSARPHWRLYR